MLHLEIMPMKRNISSRVLAISFSKVGKTVFSKLTVSDTDKISGMGIESSSGSS